MGIGSSTVFASVALFAVLAWAWAWRGRALTNTLLDAAREDARKLNEQLDIERDSRTSSLIEIATLKTKLEAHELSLKERQLALESSQAAENKLRLETDASSLRAREFETALKLREEALAEHRIELADSIAELTSTRSKLFDAEARNLEATAHLANSTRAYEELKLFISHAKEMLAADFANLAGKTLDEKSALLQGVVQLATTQSKADIDGLLKPFADRLTEFRIRVDTVYGEEAKERSALTGAVNELKTLNSEMAVQAAALTRALKGSAKVRGDWGELMLESVLKGSGLEEGKHYDRQKSNTSEEGVRLQPDIVIRLPDDRRIVVDSKVNLIAWQEAMNAESPDGQQEAIRKHAIALRQHVRELGEKNYPKSVGDSALDVTVAFVPIEGALSAALGYDDTLQTDAFERKVVFASPNTLMAILRVVERLWTRDKLQRQALEISESGGRVLDALIKFLDEFDDVGRSLDQASSKYMEARNSLNGSPQSVIKRARRMIELGVRGRKAIPAELSGGGEEELIEHM